MAHQVHNLCLDASLLLQAAGTVNTTSGNSGTTLGAGAADLGVGYQEADAVFDISAVTVTSTEGHTYQIMGSNSTSFTTEYVLGLIRFGHTSVTDQSVNTPANTRHVLHFHNVVHTSASEPTTQTTVRYVRLKWVRAGSGSTTCAVNVTYKRG
jgi:hypothetical protein